MSSQSTSIVRIALAGNPNAGKTTLFNAITGAHHKVGNYPGVTVEKREGARMRNGREYRFTDLPGIYSLTAYSVDEVVARDFVLEEKPDLIIDVIDSTNLERNLYLCLQFQELGIPVVGALNMSDEAEARGLRIDEKALSAVLDVPLVKTVGPKGAGVEALLDAVDALVDGSRRDGRTIRYGTEIEEHLSRIEDAIRKGGTNGVTPRWLAVKLLEKDANARQKLAGHPHEENVAGMVRESIAWLEKHNGKDAEIVVSEQRYAYIRGAVKETVSSAAKPVFSLTEGLDRVIMNPFLALPIFIAVLWGVFKLTFALGEHPMAWLESLFGWLAATASAAVPEGFLRSLIVDGIIGGVGGVFSFVPLIVILFFLLSILEDVGYMSRAAFATDKLLHAFGLHGQSVFPMMLGFGCSVPAIMAARTLKSTRDRIVTILAIPFMSCGAKLPVYVLLAGAFFHENAANMVMLVYAVGVVLALLSSLLLKRTVLRGEPTPFVMELPPFRAPTWRGVLWHVWEKTWQYMKKAGTIILVSSLLIWVITTFPAHEPNGAEAAALTASYEADHPGAEGEDVAAWVESSLARMSLEHSAAGRIGKAIEPAFRPLGFDWKISVATLTGFAAKEVVVSTLGILYRVGTEESEESEGLREALRADGNLNPLIAFVMMLFILVIPPCFAALAAIKAEAGWKWLGFAFCFMLALGWGIGFAAYRIGLLMGAGA
jgi:ferrous iron transport protein B